MPQTAVLLSQAECSNADESLAATLPQILRMLKRHGVSRAVLSVSEAEKSALETAAAHSPIPLSFSLARPGRGSAGHLLDAASDIEGTLFVLPVPLAEEVDLSALYRRHKAVEATLSIVVGPCGAFHCKVENGRLVAIAPKTPENAAWPGFSGLCVMEARVLSCIPQQGEWDIARQLLPAILADALPVQALFCRDALSEKTCSKTS